jgi:uncharacterized membrane protein YgcG
MKPRPGVLIGAIAGVAVAAGATWAVMGIPMQQNGQLAVSPIRVGAPSTSTPTPTPTHREKDHSGPATQVAPLPSHDVGDDHGGSGGDNSGKGSSGNGSGGGSGKSGGGDD